MTRQFLLILSLAATFPAEAQAPRLPPGAAVAPQLAQMQAVLVRQHQARTQLYREALEELKKNPKAADYADCAPGQAREACVPSVRAPVMPGPDASLVTRSKRALLIANMAYAKPIPALETPGPDADAIAQILRERFGYATVVLRNGSKADIARALNRLAGEVGVEDSVLIYYAGHGYLYDETNMGYWLPVDASVQTAAGWISNADIARFLTAIPARQLMLISDSCYSGTLTRELRVTRAETIDAPAVLRKRSVLVLTSGGEEPVSDEGRQGHSIFAGHLIRVVSSTQGLAPGAQVFAEVRRAVTREFPQTPQYGAALSAGHTAGGEYLFQSAK